MPKLFWTGKLTPPMALLVNSNNILAWIAGNSRKTAEMTERVKLGYDGRAAGQPEKYPDTD